MDQIIPAVHKFSHSFFAGHRAIWNIGRTPKSLLPLSQRFGIGLLSRVIMVEKVYITYNQVSLPAFCRREARSGRKAPLQPEPPPPPVVELMLTTSATDT
jgi:hypothetical protein